MSTTSHTSTQHKDFLEIFNMELNLSAIYFSHFSGCWASFVYSCHSILDCYNLFSGVKLSMRSFCFTSVGGVFFVAFTSSSLKVIR